MDKIEWIPASGRVRCQTLVNVKQTHSLLSCRQWRFGKTDPHSSVALLKVINFVDLQIQDKFYCQESITIQGCPLTKDLNLYKNPIFTLKSVCVRLPLR